MKLDVPVLFLVFNRPDTTRKVFQKIREVKPKKLYVAADGPRINVSSDQQNCITVRSIATDLDWNSEVFTLFREKNIGCRRAVISAVNWFFDHEDRGIILEDDCLPTQSFFEFCKILLDKYKEDSRIMHINGNNFGAKEVNFQKSNNSYHFSNFAQSWGWATWKRAWVKYDENINRFNKEEIKKNDYIDKLFSTKKYKKGIIERWEKVYNNKINTWDFQWQFTVITNHGLCIVPKVNQISNIGFGNNATHTLNKKSQRSLLRTEEMNFPLKHPDFIVPDKKVNRWFQKGMLGKEPLSTRIKQKLNKLIN